MILITTTAKLQELADSLQNNEFIAIDTEFLRVTTYYPKLCLIQIACDKHAYVIDALAPAIDLEPIFAILQNPDIVKVFHSGRQDLEIIYNLTGSLPRNIFDTQIAASLCGFGQSISYDNLCSELLQVKLDKSLQFTDWTKRPLTDAQLTYASLDVIHLRSLYSILQEKLQQSNRLLWISSATANLLNPQLYNMPLEDAWQKVSFNFNNSSARLVKLVKALAKLREQLARKSDIPRGHVIKDHLLLAIASAAPHNLQGLKAITGISEHICHEYGAQITAAISAAKNAPDEKIASKNSHDKHNSTVHILLKLLLKIKSKEHNVTDKLIATNEELAIIAKLAVNHADFRNLPSMQDWRYDIFGQFAIALKQGQSSLAIKGNEVVLRELS
jgi:ribonuclease D